MILPSPDITGFEFAGGYPAKGVVPRVRDMLHTWEMTNSIERKPRQTVGKIQSGMIIYDNDSVSHRYWACGKTLCVIGTQCSKRVVRAVGFTA